MESHRDNTLKPPARILNSLVGYVRTADFIIRDLWAEVERLEQENAEPLTTLCERSRQRDMLAEGLINVIKTYNCRACEDGDCCLHATHIARQALAGAGMEEKE